MIEIAMAVLIGLGYVAGYNSVDKTIGEIPKQEVQTQYQDAIIDVKIDLSSESKEAKEICYEGV